MARRRKKVIVGKDGQKRGKKKKMEIMAGRGEKRRKWK